MDHFYFKIGESFQSFFQLPDVVIDGCLDRNSVSYGSCADKRDDCQKDLIQDKRKSYPKDTESNTDNVFPYHSPLVRGDLSVKLIQVAPDGSPERSPEVFRFSQLQSGR